MRVFVSSPYSRGGRATNEEMAANAEMAKKFVEYVTSCGHAPFAPHVFYTSILDEATDRALGMGMGLKWLQVCDELWMFGDATTAGMFDEMQLADRLDIPVRRFYAIPKEPVTLEDKCPD